ncbi:MAG TPA: type II secretion system protein GspG [Thermoanaerobaculia bacterium]|jgi:general secretion pathway protein G
MYCTFCGTEVAPGTAVCPQCGNPPGGVRQPPPTARRSTSWPLIVILAAGGCLVLVVFSGIIAALLIPNFLDALQKAKQKRTLADMREVVTALVAYATDNGSYPAGENLEELSGALAPKHLASVPTVDGWKRPFRYVCWQESPGSPRCEHFRIASAGRDGVFESADLSQYGEGTFEVTDYDRDIVAGDGFFLQYPKSASPPGPPPP